MKLLVYGAGVLGSLYAARLFEAGHDVSLVARGQRMAALRERGVLLAEGDSEAVRTVPVPVVEHPTGAFDLILVFVRSHQVEALRESLASLEGDVLFLLNWAAGAEPLAKGIGQERVLLGFANQGGTMDGEVVRYRKSTPLTRLISMPIGEIDGRATPRVDRALQTLRSAGFAAKAEPRIVEWLTTHAAFEVPLGQAVHMAGGPAALAGNPGAIRTMIQLIRVNLATLPTRPVPRSFGALRTVPVRILVPVFTRFLRSSAAEPLNTATPAVTAELELLAAQLSAIGAVADTATV